MKLLRKIKNISKCLLLKFFIQHAKCCMASILAIRSIFTHGGAEQAPFGVNSFPLDWTPFSKETGV